MKENLLNYLSDHDLKLIDEYRQYYAPEGYEVCQKSAPIEEILKVWALEKERLFKTLFKDSLILEKPILFKQDGRLLRSAINDLIYSSDMTEIINYLYKEIKNYNPQISCYEINDMISNLFSASSLQDNIYYGIDLSIFKPDGNVLKIQRGCKALKLIQKLGMAFGKSEEIEEFRIAHSMLTNHRVVGGTLCLSIHPLDYMTMSDNDNDWHTCMSWTADGGGEYKQGTVEMMNSECVIVAYLKSDRCEFKWGDYDHQEWNNKKWRQLFIVKPEYVLGIKPYPYESEELTKAAQVKIMELLGWGTPELYSFEAGKNNKCGDRTVKIEPEYGAMYNDFNRCEHWIGLNPNSREDIYEVVQVSGPSQCMVCGHTFEEWWSERMLCCRDCVNVEICYDCGDIINLAYSNRHCDENGNCYCEECFWEHHFVDDLDGETKFCGEEYWIYLSRSNEGLGDTFRLCKVVTNIPVAELDEWFKEVHIEPGVFEDKFYVKPKDLTEKGMKVFNIDDDYLADYTKPISDESFYYTVPF